MKLDIQRFGGRGASSSNKNSGRSMLQDYIIKSKRDFNDNTRIMMVNSEGGVLFNAKITQINSQKYVDDLRRPAKDIVYRSKANTIIIRLPKEKNLKDIPF